MARDPDARAGRFEPNNGNEDKALLRLFIFSRELARTLCILGNSAGLNLRAYKVDILIRYCYCRSVKSATKWVERF